MTLLLHDGQRCLLAPSELPDFELLLEGEWTQRVLEFQRVFPVPNHICIVQPCCGEALALAESEAACRAVDLPVQVKDASHILVPIKYGANAEKARAKDIMAKLPQESRVKVLLIQVLDGEVDEGDAFKHFRQLLDIHGSVIWHQAPPQTEEDVQALLEEVELKGMVCQARDRRMDSKITVKVDEERLKELHEQHRQVLWEQIPSAMMQQMKPCQPNLPHGQAKVSSTSNYQVAGPKGFVGEGDNKFVFVRRIMEGQNATIYEARKRGVTDSFAMRVIVKEKVQTPQALEAQYRGIVLLNSTAQHPHLARCLEQLNTSTILYCAFPYVGDLNSRMLLEDAPNHCLGADSAHRLFMQIGSGVAQCHSKNIVVRDIALEHAVVRDVDGLPHWTLVDFRCALMVQGQTTLAIFCGTMPTIPPEVLGEPQYQGQPMDAWNLGMVVLEAVGGLGVLNKMVSWGSADLDKMDDRVALAERIRNCFERDSRHLEALTSGGQDVDTAHPVYDIVTSLVASRVANRGSVVRHMPEGPQSWRLAPAVELELR